MGLRVVKLNDVEPQHWGEGTNQFERTLWHLLTPATGSKHCWFAYQETPPGRMGEWHQHAYDELYYVTKGVATVTEENGPTFKVNPGETIFIPANTRHQTKNEGNETLGFLFVYAPPPKTMNYNLWIQTTSSVPTK